MNRTIKNNKKINSKHINALRHWVTEDNRNYRLNKNGVKINDTSVDERIKELVRMMPPLTESILVYRGHEHTAVIKPRNWFSTSDIRAKADEFTKNGCCLFKIYVQPGIRVIDVHSFLQKHKKSADYYEDEHEIIVEGNGEFYKDYNKTEKGFKEVKGELVTYYFPKDKNNNNTRNTHNNRNTKKNNIKLNSKRIINRIPEEEYELINSVIDLRPFIQKGEIVNNSTLEEVLEKIKATTSAKGY